MSPNSKKAAQLQRRLSINPDEPADPRPAAQEPDRTPSGPAADAAPAATGQGGNAPRSSRASAVEDPAITPGKKDYRSFYVEDAVFARFRAAIYWLARREDSADDVPESMSAAVEAWMDQTAADLEQRYNDGQVFRAPPGTRRRRRGPSRSN